METIHSEQKSNKKAVLIIGIVSALIPIVVAFLMFAPQTGKLGDFDVSFLPHLNGIINTAVSLCLLAGLISIKNKREDYHRAFMFSAFALSAVFLVSYVIFHFQGTTTYFGDADGNGVLTEAEKALVSTERYFYLFILLTHIVLAVFVVPLVLFAIYFAVTRQLEKHKKWVKWTFPVWFYVSVTGVIVYLMISQYY